MVLIVDIEMTFEVDRRRIEVGRVVSVAVVRMRSSAALPPEQSISPPRSSLLSTPVGVSLTDMYIINKTILNNERHHGSTAACRKE